MSYFDQPTIRGYALAVPVLNAALLFGIITSMFNGIKISDSVLNTGITLGTIFGVLNVILVYLIYKRRIG